MVSLIISGPYFWSGIAHPGPTLPPPMVHTIHTHFNKNLIVTEILQIYPKHEIQTYLPHMPARSAHNTDSLPNNKLCFTCNALHTLEAVSTVLRQPVTIVHTQIKHGRYGNPQVVF